MINFYNITITTGKNIFIITSILTNISYEIPNKFISLKQNIIVIVIYHTTPYMPFFLI